METQLITTLAELGEIAKHTLALCSEKGAHVITLKGDLGAGKTAFAKELARIIEIEEEVTSPTFVIMKSYESHSHPYFKTLTHIDAYRIESEEEMKVLKFNELLEDKTKLVVIEWPEKIPSLIPSDSIRVEFVLNNDGTRKIMYGN